MRKLSLLLVSALAFSACSDDASEAPLAVTDISAQNLVVGETVDFYGRGFSEKGSTRLNFKGTFRSYEGESSEVDLEITPFYNGKVQLNGEELQVLTWSRFGPFQNPFTNRANVGTFKGKIIPTTEDEDGNITEGDAMDLSLNVQPSLTIEELQPFEADCGAPALRGLAGIPYRMTVRTAGIDATRFEFTISKANNQNVLTVVREMGEPSATATVGNDFPIIFDPIDDDDQFYVALINVKAYDNEGHMVETALPFSIHRPIEVSYNNNYELAERYTPVPVSSVIPGSIDTKVCYQESETESRQQSVSMTISQNWSNSTSSSLSQSARNGISVGSSESQSNSWSQSENESTSQNYNVSYSESNSNNVSLSSTDGENWSWNMSQSESNDEYQSHVESQFVEGSVSGSVSVSASGSIPGLAKVSGSVETSASVRTGASTSQTEGSRHSSSSRQGYSTSGSQSQTQSFGSTTSDSQSQSLGGSYALSNSHSTSLSDSATRSQSQVWSIDNGSSISASDSNGGAMAESQTWSTSNSTTTSSSYCASIPKNKAGMWFRQTTRYVKRAEVKGYNLCGVATHLGELQFNDWAWAVDLAIGTTEDVQNKTSLPPARCFIAPCD